MSKEKQIEEMAKPFCKSEASCYGYDCLVQHPCRIKTMCEALYNAGYRKQSEGENIGTLHPVDEFICSKCGIVLEGWSRVVTDEDDCDRMFYEYEFKYCPNCGARMKGGVE